MSFMNNTANDTAAAAAGRKVKLGEKAVFVTVDFSSFSGQATAKDAKIFTATGEDAAAVTDKPRKRLLDKAALRFVPKHYMRIKRMMGLKGVPIWGGWLFSKDEFDSVKAEFKAICGEFSAEADAFVGSYEALLNEQCAKYPELEAFIRRDAPEPAEVRGRFGIMMSPPLAINLRPQDDDDETASSIAGAIFMQFAAQARELLESLQKQAEATQHALRPVRELREKANKFAFVDGVFDGVVGFFDALLGKLPKAGKLNPGDKAILMLALGMMKDEDKLRGAATQIQQMDLESLLMGGGVAAPVAAESTSVDAVDEEVEELLALRAEQEVDSEPAPAPVVAAAPAVAATPVAPQLTDADEDILGGGFSLF